MINVSSFAMEGPMIFSVFVEMLSSPALLPFFNPFMILIISSADTSVKANLCLCFFVKKFLYVRVASLASLKTKELATFAKKVLNLFAISFLSVISASLYLKVLFISFLFDFLLIISFMRTHVFFISLLKLSNCFL